MLNGLIHTYINKVSLTCMFKGTKILGGNIPTMFFVKRYVWGFRKTLVRGFLLVGTLFYIHFGDWAFLHIFYIGKYGKTAKITYFDVLSPLKGVFCANFIPYSKGHNVWDILGQFWNIEIFILWNGGFQSWKKLILGAKIAYFQDYEPFNKVFGANFVP